MPQPFLLNLPLELRTHIYSYLFTTPKNRIELDEIPHSLTAAPHSRYRILPLLFDPGKEIGLSFLRTSKQIYEEAKDLVWQYNTLYLATTLSPGREGVINPIVATGLKHHVQSVQLDVDLLFDKTISGRLTFGHNLSILEDWANEGCLVSVTLNATSMLGPNHFASRQLARILKKRADPVRGLTYEEYLKELRIGTSPQSALSNIKRCLVINTGDPTLDTETCRPKYPIDPRYGSPLDILREVAVAWGGRLEVNGILAYYEGNPVKNEIFLEQVEPYRYLYNDEVCLWLMTEVIKEPFDGEDIKNLLLNMDFQGRAAYYCNFESELQALMGVHGIRQISNEVVEHLESKVAGTDNH